MLLAAAKTGRFLFFFQTANRLQWSSTVDSRANVNNNTKTKSNQQYFKTESSWKRSGLNGQTLYTAFIGGVLKKQRIFFPGDESHLPLILIVKFWVKRENWENRSYVVSHVALPRGKWFFFSKRKRRKKNNAPKKIWQIEASVIKKTTIGNCSHWL